MSNPKSYKLVWKTGSVFHNNVVKTNKHTKFLCRCFITKECSDDLRSTILEFDHLTKKKQDKPRFGRGAIDCEFRRARKLIQQSTRKVPWCKHKP